MAVAAIAEIHLKKSILGTEAWKWATDLITPFSDLCGEINHPFVESATWADKIRVAGWGTMFNWHFNDQKLAEEGFVIPEDNTSDENVVWAIDTVTTFLIGNKKDFSGKSKEILGKSLEMRNLIHWIGDIH
jgi:S1/P1 Nuclease